MQEQRADERRRRRREAPGRRAACAPSGRSSRAPAAAGVAGARSSAACSAAVAPGAQLGVLVEQQREAAAGALQQRACRSRPCRAAARSAIARSTTGWRARGARPSRRARRCRARAPRSRTAAPPRSARDRVEAAHEQLALLGVDDAEGDLDARRAAAGTSRPCVTAAVRVDVVDPSAYTPPYDHALCAALARAGRGRRAGHERVRLRRRCRRAEGYAVDERFYRRAPGGRGRARRVAAKLASTCPTCCATARHGARGADVVHFQWLTVQPLDVHLLPRSRGRSSSPPTTSCPREPRPGQLRGAARGSTSASTRSSSTPSTAARGCVEELGVAPGQGARDPARRLHHSARRRAAAARARRRRGARRPVLRPAAPVQGHRRAARGLARRSRARSCGSSACRGWTPRRCGPRRRPACASSRASSPTREVAALFRRADLAVLPYREIDQSGVLFTALGAGTPLVLSAVGGFPEVAADGAAELVPAGDAAALRDDARPAARRSGCPRAPRRRRRARAAARALRLGRDRAAASRPLCEARGMSEWRETNRALVGRARADPRRAATSTTSRRSWPATRSSTPSRSRRSGPSTASRWSTPSATSASTRSRGRAAARA